MSLSITTVWDSLAQYVRGSAALRYFRQKTRLMVSGLTFSWKGQEARHLCEFIPTGSLAVMSSLPLMTRDVRPTII
jgi:hypothetical protein